ncbi:uncharacterized protein LOC130239010 isoform X1 [Danio aesculapii]|uniref:uncharacterized protein LOC130239010 isoform X1 n=1 Tax=Danio aesculapii TaxID=1142201 RepID=UPI0024C0153D|nr:uncharacterized protein LOC130239010 isoform X1 [Danio aesculapii]
MKSECEDKACHWEVKAMTVNKINAVQVFMLLWGFTAVCQTDADACNVRCNDVTGTVGKEVIFTCSFSEQCTEGCDKLYKFQYSEKYNDSTICREEFPDDACEKKKTFTCRYTPDTAMKETIRFFLQTNSSTKTAEFTVEILGHESRIDGSPIVTGSAGHENTPVSVISAVVDCIIIIFIIIIILTIIIIYKKHPDAFQRIQMIQITGQNCHDSNTEQV